MSSTLLLNLEIKYKAARNKSNACRREMAALRRRIDEHVDDLELRQSRKASSPRRRRAR